MMNEFDPRETLANPFSAGIIGSLVALRWSPGKTWFDRFLNVSSSAAVVWYGCPALINIFNIQTDAMTSFIGFVTGCLGLNFFAKMYEGIKQTEVAGIITSYFRKG